MSSLLCSEEDDFDVETDSDDELDLLCSFTGGFMVCPCSCQLLIECDGGTMEIFLFVCAKPSSLEKELDLEVDTAGVKMIGGFVGSIPASDDFEAGDVALLSGGGVIVLPDRMSCTTEIFE
ncbi:hypothetical protein M514_08332 [Trichuris suis]|uniref:Uncharacterized protein n=1 Tax=Trichuris suis TaxID=68888 RepID=A0A085N1Q6_9BILA|nr:hypothetical protein M513_08332 [Trichuris suis]KFD63402.1 hypothetical protein M514_08332 [Trichuris suis]